MQPTYTVAQYKAWVLDRLQNIPVDDSVMLQFLQATNREIVNMSLGGAVWPFMEDNFVGTVEAGSWQYNFESNWRDPYDLTLVAPDNNARHLRRIEYEDYRQLYPDPGSALTTPTPPTVWAVYKRTFLVGPTPPDQDYTLDMAFVRAAATPTLNTDTLDVPDEWSELVILGIQRRAYRYRRRFDQAQIIDQDYDLLLQQMIHTVIGSTRGSAGQAKTGWFGA